MKTILKFVRRYPTYIALILLCIAMSFLSPAFLTKTNIINLLSSESGRGVLAMASAFVLITGGIDLSISPVAACASCVAASLVQDADYAQRIIPGGSVHPVIVAVLAGLAVGLIIGAFNGAVIVYLNVPPFIATLGGTTIAKGAALMYTQAKTVPMLSKEYLALGQTMVFGQIPIIIFYFIIITIIAWIILNKTKWGKCLYAIGGNKGAAVVAGVNVQLNTLAAYVWSGLLAAFVGIFLSARSAAGAPGMAEGYELDAIAAAIVGGVSSTGGIGTISGVVVGVLLLGVLNNGFLLMGVSPYLQQVIKGFIIIGAVAVDTARAKKS